MLASWRFEADGFVIVSLTGRRSLTDEELSPFRQFTVAMLNPQSPPPAAFHGGAWLIPTARSTRALRGRALREHRDLPGAPDYFFCGSSSLSPLR